MNDQPSSDDLIRQAKESFLNVAEERDAEVQARVEDIKQAAVQTTRVDQRAKQSQVRRPVPAAKATRTVRDPARGRRVRPRAERTSGPAPTDAGARRSGSGMILRAIGSFMLLMVAGLWILLIIGFIGGESEVGDALGGGVVLTLIPFILGMLLRRAGIRQGTRA